MTISDFSDFSYFSYSSDRPDGSSGTSGGDFSLYHDLMAFRVREILLALTPFDAYIMEAGSSLASRIVNEYRGLNLSRPPRLTLAGSGEAVLALVAGQQKGTRGGKEPTRERRAGAPEGPAAYDLVVSLPRLPDMDCRELATRLHQRWPDLPVVLLAHSLAGMGAEAEAGRLPENLWLWRGDSELLLAIVKNLEDHANVDRDVAAAGVGVILVVEDDPGFLSFLLPAIYREVVRQTQALLDEGLNEEHRLLLMRARPKILVARDFHRAMDLYHRYQKNLRAVISDTRFRRGDTMDSAAGLRLLTHVRAEMPDLPLLLLSSDPANLQPALAVPAVFLTKDHRDLHGELHRFFLDHLGFGDFVFRRPDGGEIGRAATLIAFERALRTLPEESFLYHARRGHFVTWLMARSCVSLAREIGQAPHSRKLPATRLRRTLCRAIRRHLHGRQAGVVSRFHRHDFDAEINEFVVMGQGEMGGKGMGLAFFRRWLVTHHHRLTPDLMPVWVPPTTIVASGWYEEFLARLLAEDPLVDAADDHIDRAFLGRPLPPPLEEDLAVFLDQVRHPLVVRSSSTLEDAHRAPYAGLFRTLFLANDHPDAATRLAELSRAIRLVWASSLHREPRAFGEAAGSSAPGPMAVMIQQLVGRTYDNLIHPALAGVAQSWNHYPLAPMRAEDGVVHLALGLGRTVVAGGRCLRFCPRHPGRYPQFAGAGDFVAGQQLSYWGLRPGTPLGSGEDNLEERPMAGAATQPGLALFFSRYRPEEGVLRDGPGPGIPVATFAAILKHGLFPLAPTLTALLQLGREGLGGEVEMEFAVDMDTRGHNARLAVLQIRPLAAGGPTIRIPPDLAAKALCRAGQALGHGRRGPITRVLLVDPQGLAREAVGRQTPAIAREIGELNGHAAKEGTSYLLVGPGRWGSADPNLGIPVGWAEINRVAAMVEISSAVFAAEPSQGTHFFHNITSQEIPYLTVGPQDHLDLETLRRLTPVAATEHCLLLAADPPLVVVAAGGLGVIVPEPVLATGEMS